MSNRTRRDTLEIISDLLESMNEPRRLTHLLYVSNLSYSQLTKYLKMIVKMGLAEEQHKPYHSYLVTSDGHLFKNLIKRRIEIVT